MNVNYSQSLVSGAILGVTDSYLLNAPAKGAIINGGILAGSDAIAQMLSKGNNPGVIRDFLYRQHEPLSAAVIYTLVQEFLDLIMSRRVKPFSSTWKTMLANLLAAIGSVALGRESLKLLGMTPGSVSAAEVVAAIAQPSSGQHMSIEPSSSMSYPSVSIVPKSSSKKIYNEKI
jgi:hypothetical protein